MAQVPMPLAVERSPIGHLAAELAIGATTLTLQSGDFAGCLIHSTGRLTIGPRSEAPETLGYTQSSGETLTLSSPTAQAWAAGSEVSRVITAADLNGLIANVQDHESRFVAKPTAAGQIPIGHTDGTITQATITAGANITVTNTDGSISIAATGSSVNGAPTILPGQCSAAIAVGSVVHAQPQVMGSFLNWELAEPTTVSELTIVGILQALTPLVFAYLLKWGTFGTGDNQFSGPADIAVDSAGNVYVTNSQNYQIQKFDSSGTFILKFGGYGSGDGQFVHPYGIAVDSAGNVYVTDTYYTANRIQKFTSTGTFITKWGTSGSGDGQFNNPCGIAVDGAGNVYVADTNANRIQKFTSTGTFITKWGSGGSGDGQFSGPTGITIDDVGNVYVAELMNNRIQKFTSTGTFITKWGTSGSGDGQFNGPYGIRVDSSNNIYVADSGNNRIQVFSSSGTFLLKWGSAGSDDGQFSGPQAPAVDSAGNVYVTDYMNNRIQKFVPTSASLSVAVAGIVPIPETAICPGYAVWLGAGGTLSETSTGDVPKFLGWVVDSTHLYWYPQN